MAFYHGIRVSYPWYTICNAYEHETGRPVALNDGKRTMADQRQRVRDHGVWSSSNPTGAALPSPNAPHIRVGRSDHAMDINHPQNLHFIAWCATKGLRIIRPIAAEPWHCEAINEDALVSVAKKLRKPSKRERLLSELAGLREVVRKRFKGNWKKAPRRKRRADSIKRWLKRHPKRRK